MLAEARWHISAHIRCKLLLPLGALMASKDRVWVMQEYVRSCNNENISYIHQSTVITEY